MLIKIKITLAFLCHFYGSIKSLIFHCD
uniref:Uncharacterized protein n=1 Tax=Rhizophora mucronata TaxID=61149 RepID=A0A2P2R2N1_RHIMU